MKKFIPIVLSVSIVLTSLNALAAKDADSFTANAVFQGSIPGIGISTAELKRKAGNPLRKESPKENKCQGYKYSTWIYKGFSAEVSIEPAGSSKKSVVTSLNIKSPAFKTRKGVRVGDLLSKASKLYGTEIETDNNQNKSVSLTNVSDGAALSFVASKDGRIKYISVSTNC
jgi:hypothetical protein